MRFTQNSTPIRREIQESCDDDDVKLSARERKLRAFASDETDRRVAQFGSQLLGHPKCRLERDNLTSKLGESYRHATGAGANVEDGCAWPDCPGGGETLNHLVRQNGAMPMVVDLGVAGEIDPVAHDI